MELGTGALIEFSSQLSHLNPSQVIAALGAAGLPFLVFGWITPIVSLGIGLPLAWLAGHLTGGWRRRDRTANL